MIVETKLGAIEGVQTDHAYLYQGIPYAKPPIGHRRFRSPEPLEPWNGVYLAKTFPPMAPQAGQSPGSFYYKEFYAHPESEPAMDEDCLYLNIWTPLNSSEPAPVAVWIHGGGFMNGYASEIEFDGDAFAKRGIILVTVQYRLGLLGFFAHPELTQRDGHSGNYGILDQIAAINWIREHIAAFGGDPNRITIFGQSAGGMSVRALISSPLMNGKIHAAVIQSAGGYKSTMTPSVTMEVLEKASVRFLKRQHMSLAEFQSLPWAQVIKYTQKYILAALPYTHSYFSTVPCIDGYVLPNHVDHALEQGKILPISYLIGCTRNDFMVKKAAVRNPERNNLYTSDRDFCQLANAKGKPAYAYYFTRQLPGDRSGAFHSSELWYLFGTLPRCWRPMETADYDLSEEMTNAWAAFMKTGNPGWSACTSDNPYVKVFDIK